MFKLYPSIITPDNLHTNIIISSILESPVDTLYHSLQKLFAPVLVKEGSFSCSVDPKVQELVTQLEAGLGTIMRRQNKEGVVSASESLSEDNILGIITLYDEYQFWVEMANASTKLSLKERAQYFQEKLQSLVTEFANLGSQTLPDAMRIIEIAQYALEDIWMYTEHKPYTELRMAHLLEVISGTIGRFVQRKLADLNCWSGEFSDVHMNLNDGLMMCEGWTIATDEMTSKCIARPWKSGRFVSEMLSQIISRIKEVRFE